MIFFFMSNSSLIAIILHYRYAFSVYKWKPHRNCFHLYRRVKSIVKFTDEGHTLGSGLGNLLHSSDLANNCPRFWALEDFLAVENDKIKKETRIYSCE